MGKKNKSVILVGAKGFWDLRDLVNAEVFKNKFNLSYSDDFLVSCDLARKVAAIVIADQPFGASMVDKFPNLKTIARTGTGYDNIDVVAAHKRKVVVTRVAELNAESVSEFALGLIFSLMRQIPLLHGKMCEGVWWREPGVLISEATFGLIGLGTVGRKLANKLNVLGAKRIVGWNRTFRPKVKDAALHSNVELIAFDEVLSESDVVIVALALTPDTRHLIDARALKLMKPTVYLLNVSRGAVVDENTLAECVESGKIAGAALDVFSEEPPVADPFNQPFVQKLTKCAKSGRNVILTPHNAFFTKNASREISLKVAQNIVDVLSGRVHMAEIVEV